MPPHLTPETVTTMTTPHRQDPRPHGKRSGRDARAARPNLWRIYDREFGTGRDAMTVEDAEAQAGVPGGTLRNWLRVSTPEGKVPPRDRIAAMYAVFEHHGKHTSIAELSDALALDGNYEFSLILDADEKRLIESYRQFRGAERKRGVQKLLSKLAGMGQTWTTYSVQQAVQEAFRPPM